jgi:hypothetical protein
MEDINGFLFLKANQWRCFSAFNLLKNLKRERERIFFVCLIDYVFLDELWGILSY